MSSDGSVSSRISQFGLYRTIDARTEEFLKLSKKRQIKQGCVCAAISTAITVTVVVIIILIYEYNVVANARSTIGKSNWIMNTSVDFPALQERFTEANIKIDGITLKLLPILLKALHKNRDIEKITEDPTSLRPPYETRDTTDMAYTKNIFADTRNWMKIPDSRLYTIEYKTSPIVYFKNPTRNVEYFTKIRKIRDYQRILNYVDKMISEKNSLGSTQPMNSFKRTDNPLRTTTPAAKRNLVKKIKKLQTTTPKTSTKEKNSNCKCPHKLNELMKKLLNSIQQLLTYFSGTTSNVVVNKCSPTETNDIKADKQLFTTTTDNNDVIKLEVTQPTIYETFLNRHKYTVDLGTATNHDIRREHSINTIMNFIKPNNRQRYSNKKFEPQEAFSGIYNDIGPSESINIIKQTSTQILPTYTTNTKTPSDAVTTVADYILQKGIYDISSDTKLSSTTFSDSDYSGNEDYLETNANQEGKFNKLEIHNTELMKSNKTSVEKNYAIEEKSVKYPFKGVRARKKTYDNFGVMRKLGNLVYDNNNNSNSLPMLHRFAPILNSTTTKAREITNNIKHNSSFIKPTHKTWNFKNETMDTKTTTIKHEVPKLKNIDTIMPEHDIEKSLEGNISTEVAVKQIEEAIEIINNGTIPDKADKFTTSDNTWELVKLEENTSPMILPPGRSTYLEMQRNDYAAKHDETQDYDNDFLD